MNLNHCVDTDLQDARWRGALSGIENVQVAREGKRNDVGDAAPGVANLLVIDACANFPCGDSLTGLNVP
jgi:hypothetical protein